LGSLSKYVRAAAWMPYALAPKKTVLRYWSRISSLDIWVSSCIAKAASRNLRASILASMSGRMRSTVSRSEPSRLFWRCSASALRILSRTISAEARVTWSPAFLASSWAMPCLPSL